MGGRAPPFFVAEEDRAAVVHPIAHVLPDTYRGWPLRIGRDALPLEHRVEITTLSVWCVSQLGVDPLARPLTPTEWLVLPQ